MKALIVITGRGIGGDAVNALNIIKSLEDVDIQCEIALDTNAPGLLFKKNGYSWHKVPVPQAGGHAATKLTTIKAGIRTLKAVLKTRKLIKKLSVDVVVGVIGGGAIVGCISAKLTKVPGVGITDTPLDTKICTRLNECIVLPEAQMFKQKTVPENVHKSYFPLTKKIEKGDGAKAVKKIIELDTCKIFDETKPTLLFSSGSSLFEGMVVCLSNYCKHLKENNRLDDYNLLLIGNPLKKEYMDLIDEKQIINLGYINWINDLYELIDLAILTDDGVMIQESVACELPAIALTRVKYGRYHNMESIFPDAILESELDQANSKIDEALGSLDRLKNNSKKYSEKVLSANEKIAKIILEEAKK
ncbi:MAG: glycosyltransferase family 1 protein [Methanobrevibacter sp.]|jgi:UDP-N-acetylglucosamine--N-acetylmuramyl-(pentapeptide) pyrophosphoryl-undecaprenol N-acetylglucosamine transferase|nr:glycosyltransferase family 1 protein [Candidatus Methanovirga aequatorialis]